MAETGADAALAPASSASAYGYAIVSGGVTMGDAYVASGKYLAVGGALSGRIGLTHGAPAENVKVAQGSGYTLTASDAEKLSSNNKGFAVQFASNTATLKALPQVTITTQPQSVTVCQNGTATLTVETSAAGVTYQWYSCADANGSDAQAIPGATGAAYSAPTDELSRTYYYCVLQADGCVDTQTDVVYVSVVNANEAADVIITRQPQGGEWGVGQTVELTVEAATYGFGTPSLSYQWFVANTETGEIAKVENATSATLSFEAEDTGEHWYYCVVTNTEEGKPEAKTAQTETVRVNVIEAQAYFNGAPYGTIDGAVNALNASSAAEKTLVITRDGTLSKAITLSSGTLTISSEAENGVTVARAADFGTAMLRVTGGTLTLENVTVDGGAIWSETAQDSVLGRGTVNNGASAQQPLLLVTGGEVVLAEGAVLQNNDNTSAYSTSGGAVRLSGGTLRIAGGLIRNNDAWYGGAVLSLNTSLIEFESGTVSGNYATSAGGAFCIDNSADFTMTNGEITGNRGDAGNNNKGGIIWLSNGTAKLSGGSITGNAAATGTVFINRDGTVNVGAVTISGNTADPAPGIHTGSSGKLNITGVPTLTDGIYLPTGRQISIQCDLTGAQAIPVTMQTLSNSGAVIANASTEAQAAAAAKVLTLSGCEVYANGQEVGYRKIAAFTVVQELSANASAVVGNALTLTYQAKPDIGTVQYAWYRCENAQGANPARIASQTGSTLNMSNLGAGTYYFYCVATSSSAAGSIQSQICTVTVTPYVPAAIAIAKFKALG